MGSFFTSYVSTGGYGVDYLWLLFLLPFPFLLFRRSKNQKENSATEAISASHFRYFTKTVATDKAPTQSNLNRQTKVILWTAWFFFIFTLCRPFMLGDPIQLPDPTRDILIALDLSESMAEKDMVVNDAQAMRLAAAKSVLDDFIKKRKNDRIGLIFFADTAYLAAPLTTDLNTLSFVLEQAQVGLIGDATSITDTVGLTVKMFENYEGDLPTLLLLTDGDNTSGNITKAEAIDLAASSQIEISAIVMSPQLQQGVEEIDLSFLSALVSAGRGEVFLAEDTNSLAKIYADLDNRVLSTTTTLSYSPKNYLSFYTFLCSLLLTCLALLPKLGLGYKRNVA